MRVVLSAAVCLSSVLFLQAPLSAWDFRREVNDAIESLHSETEALSTSYALIEAEDFSNTFRRMNGSRNDEMQIRRTGGTGAAGASLGSFAEFDFENGGGVSQSQRTIKYPVKGLLPGAYGFLYVRMAEDPAGKFSWAADNGPFTDAASTPLSGRCTASGNFNWYELRTDSSSLPVSVTATEAHTLLIRPSSGRLSVDAFLLSSEALSSGDFCRLGIITPEEQPFFSRSPVSFSPKRMPGNQVTSMQIVTARNVWSPAMVFLNVNGGYDELRIEVSKLRSSDGSVLPWTAGERDLVRLQKIVGTKRLIDINLKTQLPQKQLEWDMLGNMECQILSDSMVCRRPIRAERDTGMFGFYLDIRSPDAGIYNSTIKVSGLKDGQVSQIGRTLSLKVVTLPFDLPVPAKDHGMYIKDKITSISPRAKGGLSKFEPEFDVLIDHGVRVPVFRDLGAQTQRRNDKALARLTAAAFQSWKSRVDKAEEGLEGSRPVRLVDWLKNMLKFYGADDYFADPVFYSADSKQGLSSSDRDALVERSSNLYSKVQVPGAEVFLKFADEITAKYDMPPRPSNIECLPCTGSDCSRPDRCFNHVGGVRTSYLDSWQRNVRDLYSRMEVPLYLTLRFLDQQPENAYMKMEDIFGPFFKNTRGVFDYSGGSFDWSTERLQNMKIAALNRSFPEILRWNYNNNAAMGKKDFYFGHANRLLNGVFLWNAPFSGELAWINHDEAIGRYSSYAEKQERGTEPGSPLYYVHRTLYTIRDRATGGVLPTLRLKGYREGVTDFRIFQKLSECRVSTDGSPGILEEIAALYEEDPSGESLALRLNGADLERIRLKAYREIMAGCPA